MVKALILLKKCYVALTKLVMHWLSVLVLACQAKMTLCYNYPIMTPPPRNVFAALLPISSPFCMPLRIMMGLASGWEILLSIVILVAFCYIVAKIAIKVYSNAILNYGTKMSLHDLLSLYKEK